MNTCTIEIFYDGNRQGKAIERFYSENILEEIFAEWNHGSGRECQEFILGKYRSMMPGDVIVILMDNGTETAWQCEPRGWSKLWKDSLAPNAD